MPIVAAYEMLAKKLAFHTCSEVTSATCFFFLFLSVGSRGKNWYFMLKKEEGHTEVGSFYFTHFLSDTDLVKRVYTFCLLEIFTD